MNVCKYRTFLTQTVLIIDLLTIAFMGGVLINKL